MVIYVTSLISKPGQPVLLHLGGPPAFSAEWGPGFLLQNPLPLESTTAGILTVTELHIHKAFQLYMIVKWYFIILHLNSLLLLLLLLLLLITHTAFKEILYAVVAISFSTRKS